MFRRFINESIYGACREKILFDSTMSGKEAGSNFQIVSEYIHTYVIGHYGLASHTTHIVYVNFIQE